MGLNTGNFGLDNGMFGLPGVGGNWNPLSKTLGGNAGYNPAQPQYQVARPDQERAQGNEVRGQQSEYNQWLQNAAMGKGPSVAQSQLSQGRDKAISAAASQAAAARGGNAALANRSAVQTAGNMGMQANRDAAALRAQEQMGYANQWGQGLQAQRSGDLMGRGQSIDEQKAQLQAQTGYQGMQAQTAAGNAERGQGILGSVLGGGPGALFSDQATKTTIDSPGEAKQNVFTSFAPGAPAMTTGGPAQMQGAQTAYGQQFAGMGNPTGPGIGASAAEDAAKAEQTRQTATGIAQGAMNAKNDHGAGLISSIIGGLISDQATKTAIDSPGEAKVDVRDAVLPLLSGLAPAAGTAAALAARRAAQWLSPRPAMQAGATAPGAAGAYNAGGARAAEGYARAAEGYDVPTRTTFDQAVITPEGTRGTDAAYRDYAAHMRDWDKAAHDVHTDANRGAAAQKDAAAGEAARAALRNRAAGRQMIAQAHVEGVRSPGEAKRAVQSGTVSPPTGRFADVEPTVAQAAQVPDKSWEYKPGFAEEANQRMGLPRGDEYGYKRKTGAMTQDYEKLPLTAGVVAHDPKTGLGKLDGGMLASTAMTAAGADARELMKQRAELEAVKRALGMGKVQNPADTVSREEWAGLQEPPANDMWADLERALRARGR